MHKEGVGRKGDEAQTSEEGDREEAQEGGNIRSKGGRDDN